MHARLALAVSACILAGCGQDAKKQAQNQPNPSEQHQQDVRSPTPSPVPPPPMPPPPVRDNFFQLGAFSAEVNNAGVTTKYVNSDGSGQIEAGIAIRLSNGGTSPISVATENVSSMVVTTNNGLSMPVYKVAGVGDCRSATLESCKAGNSSAFTEIGPGESLSVSLTASYNYSLAQVNTLTGIKSASLSGRIFLISGAATRPVGLSLVNFPLINSVKSN